MSVCECLCVYICVCVWASVSVCIVSVWVHWYAYVFGRQYLLFRVVLCIARAIDYASTVRKLCGIKRTVALPGEEHGERGEQDQWLWQKVLHVLQPIGGDAVARGMSGERVRVCWECVCV